MTVKPLLVGEDNPLSRDPRHALFPYPKHHAGGRLATTIMGLSCTAYLRRFDRVNLCAGKWSIKEAREHAAKIWNESVDRPAVVLLGAKVCAAFGREFVPFEAYATNYYCSEPGKVWQKMKSYVNIVVLPHPSGRCRLWNEPDSISKARGVLRYAGIDLPAEGVE